MTPTEVIKVCGNPRSTDDCSELNYNYGSVWIMFESGIVKAVIDAKDFQRCGSVYYHEGKARFIKK
jgi:hypothetical protein